MPRRDDQLCAGVYYHLYNLGNNRARIFFERDNNLFFPRWVADYPAALSGKLLLVCPARGCRGTAYRAEGFRIRERKEV